VKVQRRLSVTLLVRGKPSHHVTRLVTSLKHAFAHR
jgi:hypothetical protein